MKACALTIDVEDWFHILDLETGPDVAGWARLESRVEQSFLTLLDLLDKRSVRATCFFLGWVAERFPALVREADERGHEIASHGHTHTLVYTLTPEAFLDDARRSKDVLEDIIGRPVAGYRAAGFSVTEETPWFFDRVAEAGFRYSSSIFPAARQHGGLVSDQLAPYDVSCESGPLIEAPVTVTDVLGKRLCFFGGGYLRLFPYPVIKHMSRRVLDEGRPVIFYVHPREVDPHHPRLAMPAVRRFKSYVNLDTTRPKLERLTQDFEFRTLAEILLA